MRPPTIVAATPPRSSQPSNGVFLERERNDRASTRTLEVRREDGDVRLGAGGERSSRNLQNLRRVDESSSTRRGSRTRPVCSSRSSSATPPFPADDAERRAVEFDLLFVVVVGA